MPLLVHLPNKDWTSKEDAKKVAAAGTQVLATIGFGAPVFGVFAEDNTAAVPRRQAVAANRSSTASVSARKQDTCR